MTVLDKIKASLKWPKPEAKGEKRPTLKRRNKTPKGGEK